MNKNQLIASDPKISAWVSASAGTGKTKILIDRILRLLLRDIEFRKILCITFTNAAANEIKERITIALGRWSDMNSEELARNLYLLLGRESTKKELYNAKNLYNLYLKSEDSIKIQTFHSFCQSLLKQFPVESSISPNFQIMDEIKIRDILKYILSIVFSRCEYQYITDYITTNFHETVISELCSSIIQESMKFQSSINQIPIDKISEHAALAEDVFAKKIADRDKKYQIIKYDPMIQHIIGFDINIENITDFFLKKDGNKYARLKQNFINPGSNRYDHLEQLQHQVFLLEQNWKKAQLEFRLKMLLIFANILISHYEEYKNKYGFLDYDDLIIKTNHLLTHSNAKEWINYKLDGWVEHMLVDEAQDTSAMQWSIVNSIAQEFYSGDSKKAERTIFIVGDGKQSIFSFQGANVFSFFSVQQAVEKKMLSGGHPFSQVALDISYRSAPAITEIVDNTFAGIKEVDSNISIPRMNFQLSAFRDSYKGSVHLWPLSKIEKVEEKFWPYNDQNERICAKRKLATQIAGYIKTQLNSTRVLYSTKKPVTAKDFMILFRKRDRLAQEVINALQEHNVPVTGLDRIILKDNLAVLDLLSIGKFVLNKYDDLNLACLLKSPIIGVNESLLYDISANRNKRSIWENIETIISDKKSDKQLTEQMQQIYRKLQLFLELYNESDKSGIDKFFQHIVDIIGYRDVILKEATPDSADAIDEFLYLCLHYADSETSSLQNFIFWIENYNDSIKREQDNISAVRIMTVHAAKGLQSPYVILCDTTTKPHSSEHIIFGDDGRAFPFISSTFKTEDYEKILKKRKEEIHSEYLRLLYVAMTRAEDHLIICGTQGLKKLQDNCWYHLISSAMHKVAIKNSNDDELIYGDPNEYSIESSEVLSEGGHDIEYFIPIANLGNNNILRQPIQKSVVSPLIFKDYMGYGTLFHKILEDSVKSNKVELMVEHPLILTLESKSQQRIKKSIDLIMSNKLFTNMLKDYQIGTEANIGGNEEDKIKIGRIDLLLISDDEVIIIDYKSDIKRAFIANYCPENYKSQILEYKKLVSESCIVNKITTMLLWLETGELQLIEN